jgi:hypothetical protein
MKFTLVQAAGKTGKDRSTLYRAIKKGKLSGELQDDNSYLIDGAELFRVYPPKQLDSASPQGAHVVLQQAAQGELIDALRAQIDLLKNQVNREQEQADHWRNQALMLLGHQQPEPVIPTKSLLYEKLFGKK